MKINYYLLYLGIDCFLKLEIAGQSLTGSLGLQAAPACHRYNTEDNAR